jgi:serine phosphatase RsbU (regulator of sigma subunit)
MDVFTPGEARHLTPDFKYRFLLQILEKVRGTLELEEVLNNLIDILRPVIDYDAAGIFVLSRAILPLTHGAKNNLIAGVATRGFPNRVAHSDPMLSSGRGIIGHVIRTGTSVIAPDVRLDPFYVEGRPGTMSEIAVPLTSNDRVIGALNLESNRLSAFSQDDVEVLQFFARAAAIAIERAILHYELIEKRRLENQLRIAREVQSSLLPATPPDLPGYEFAAINVPTWEIGGDCYDYIKLPDGRVGVAIADVSGKGVPAALIMAAFRATLRTQVRIDHELSQLMIAVNGLLLESIGQAAFVTAVYGVLDPGNGRFVYSNCGHNPPLLLNRAGEMKRLSCGGPALGVFDEAQFEEEAVPFAPGDMLVLYTDGAIEVTDDRDQEFGEKRLERILRNSAHLPAGEVIRAVIDQTQVFAGHESYPDDFTIVVIRHSGGERESPSDN